VNAIIYPFKKRTNREPKTYHEASQFGTLETIGFFQPSPSATNLPLDRIQDCDKLASMRQLLMYLVILALVFPFRAIEAAEVTPVQKKAAQELQTSPDEEITATSEGEVEDPELHFHTVPFFEHHAQLDGRLPSLQSTVFASVDLDPQDCRPPPQA